MIIGEWVSAHPDVCVANGYSVDQIVHLCIVKRKKKRNRQLHGPEPNGLSPIDMFDKS